MAKLVSLSFRRVSHPLFLLTTWLYDGNCLNSKFTTKTGVTMFHIRLLISCITTFMAVIIAPLAHGDDMTLRAPAEDVVLKVTGDINITNGDGAALFDVDMLKELGVQEIETSTIWTEGKNVFEGVKLSDLVEAIGVSDGDLRLYAVNDYSIVIPVSEILDSPAILAYKLNGKRMSLRDKGPLWVIYPYDSSEIYQTEVYYARSIWQLNRIDITK